MLRNGGVGNVIEGVGRQEDPSQFCLGRMNPSEQYLPRIT
jgi:hypothetical protein